jgi:hypothetical protein
MCDSTWCRSFQELSNRRWPHFFHAMRGSLTDSGFGQHDSRVLAISVFLSSILATAAQSSRAFRSLDALSRLAAAAGWYLPHENYCWLSERHSQIQFDDRGRLNNQEGPAISYPDGWEFYMWHGVPVNERIVRRPTELTVKEIDLEDNLEVRRIMIERFGEKNYFLAGRVETIDDDTRFGTLLRRRCRGSRPMMMVRRHTRIRWKREVVFASGS